MFATLNVLDGTVIGQCLARRRHQEFIPILNRIEIRLSRPRGSGLCGDGALQMNGTNELITVAKYWKKWSDPRLVILVLNNRDLNQVTWEMRAQAGDLKFEAAQDVPDFRYSQYAEQLGLKGVFVDRSDQLGAAREAAFAADRPVVIEA